jgi:hypothetical protein
MTGGARIGHSQRMGGTGDEPVAPKRTFYQRMVLRDILRRVPAVSRHSSAMTPVARRVSSSYRRWATSGCDGAAGRFQ